MPVKLLKLIFAENIYTMNRFMGMMPSDEIKKRGYFRVGVGQLCVEVNAGENGWTILYADSSSECKDVVDTTENNYDKAVEVLNSHFCEVNSEEVDEPMEEM